MITAEESAKYQAENPLLDQPIPEDEWGDYYLDGSGCGEEQYGNMCIGCGCWMDKGLAEDKMSPPITSICSDCYSRHSGV